MPAKRVTNEALTIDEVVELISPSMNSHPAPPRKRERLTHLSMEEKLNRRKMKNRVAAQTARDRKKDRVSKLEKAIHLLLEENSKLRSDNRQLMVENSRLRQEREQLQKEMHATSSPCSSMPTPSSMDTLESAVLINGPLPRERVSVKSEEADTGNEVKPHRECQRQQISTR